MNQERHKRVSELFAQTIDLNPEELETFLKKECGDDHDLIEEVKSLLAHDKDESVLGATEQLLPQDLAPGERVGSYRILEKLGEGGMGVVYLAEQEEPIRRKVALKIIKLGMDTKEVVGRFEVERQALAMMSHPNIAKVLDAGATEQGRPYFVMEHVPGIPITAYCDKHRLNTKERLELYISVCQAIHHAHQKAIIHRDIKPSNVLVMVQDGKPIPKVIDFGVAKAISQRLTEKTVFTEQGRLIGTPAYMSPEQAEMTGLSVDTTTDVYSLGVMLYELLVGAPPFDPKTLRKAGLEAIYRIIREEEPPKPSTRIISLGGDAARVAVVRRTDPARLERQVRGELDWIIMRAIEKDRTRRYQGCQLLAHDIDRFLHDIPVLAGPPRASYRAKKFVYRNRVFFAASTILILAVGLSVTVTTLLNPGDPWRDHLLDRRQVSFSGSVVAAEIHPNGRSVAFVSEGVEGSNQLFIQDFASDEPINVFGGRILRSVRWSPDGSHLLVTGMRDSTYSTYLVPHHGGSFRRFTYFDAVSWSADGQAFVGVRTGQTNIHIVDIATGSRSEIKPKLTSAIWTLDVDWSTRGLLLFETSDGRGNQTIWTIRADGTQQVEALIGKNLHSPRWSPDGRRICYLVRRKHTSDMWALEVDLPAGVTSGKARRVLADLQGRGPISFSESGETVMYLGESISSNLWLVDISKAEEEGVETRQLTSGTKVNGAASFSPDGERLAFSRGTREKLNIVLMPVDGDAMEQLTFLDARCVGPVWSPDGTEIAFGSDSGGEPKVWRIPSQGGTPRQFKSTRLTESYGYTDGLAWSPGREILYLRPGNSAYYQLDPGSEIELELVGQDGLMFAAKPSSDGARVAINWHRGRGQGGIWIVSRDQAPVRISERSVSPIGWSKDDQWVYALQKSADGLSVVIRIPVGEGEVDTVVTLPLEDLMPCQWPRVVRDLLEKSMK